MDNVCNRCLFSIPSKLDLDALGALTRASYRSIKSYFTNKIKESEYFPLRYLLFKLLRWVFS